MSEHTDKVLKEMGQSPGFAEHVDRTLGLKDCDKCKYKKAIEEQIRIAELCGRIKKVQMPGSITDGH